MLFDKTRAGSLAIFEPRTTHDKANIITPGVDKNDVIEIVLRLHIEKSSSEGVFLRKLL